MAKWAKLVAGMRASQANVDFVELCGLIEHLGFRLRRMSGSHRIYRHITRTDLPLLNLQPSRGKAKPYQVRQVLDLIEGAGLEVE
jgi:predicted RNA binding protein YcfA (HicA-like mRNA interferase family)